MPEHNLKYYFSEELTNSQNEALELLEIFLESTKNCFLLKGYAGTGKTYLLRGIISYLRNNSIKYNLLAPTGKAAQIVTSGTGTRAYTIHKFIYQVDSDPIKEYENDTEFDNDTRIRYVFQLRKNSSVNSIYFIDEASMVSDIISNSSKVIFGSGSLLDDLIEFVNIQSNRLIFIGDPAQLPPVGSEFSPALNSKHLSDKYGLDIFEYELQDIVRHDNEGRIVNNATLIRNNIIRGNFFVPKFEYNDTDFIAINKNEVLNKYEMIINKEPQSTIAVISYTNKLVQSYNKMIRQLIKPGKKHIESGDKLLIVSNNYNQDIEVYNGETGIVVECDEFTESRIVTFHDNGELTSIELTFRDIILRIDDIEKNPIDLHCKIYESLLDSSQRELSSNEAKALYYDFKIRLEEEELSKRDIAINMRLDPYFNCLRVKYAYALTCHKAQGGEWDYIFLDPFTPFDKNNENYLRWLYTALTRAKKGIFIIERDNKSKPVKYPQSESFPEQTPKKVLKKALAQKQLVPSDFPLDNKIALNIYFVIQEMIYDLNIKISDIKHFPYCERYYFSKSRMKAWFNVWYTPSSKISLVESPNTINNTLTVDLTTLLKPLTGTIIPEKNLE